MPRCWRGSPGRCRSAGCRRAEVVEELAAKAEGGLLGMTSPNFHGWVIGASHPAGVAADWLLLGLGQMAGFADPAPAAAAVEEVAAGWVLDLLGLPAEAGVGFCTGATMANFTALAAARGELLRRAGWDVEAQGLFGAPEVAVVLGGEAHSSVLLCLRLLGFGARAGARARRPTARGGCARRRWRAVLDGVEGPAVVCLQAGNVVSGAFDPFAELDPARAGRRAPGCMSTAPSGSGRGAAPGLARADRRAGGGADSWAADAHKWLQVPYDCGLAMVRDAGALQRAMSITASYLPKGENRAPEALLAGDVAPGARLRGLGGDPGARARGIAEMVERHCAVARAIAARLAAEPGLDGAERGGAEPGRLRLRRGRRRRPLTRALLAAVQADGVCYPTAGRWRGREIIRVSVSAGPTTVADGERSAAAIVAAWRRVREAG